MPDLDITISTPMATYKLQWIGGGVRLLKDDAVIAHGFKGDRMTEDILFESVEKVFGIIKAMINNVLPIKKRSNSVRKFLRVTAEIIEVSANGFEYVQDTKMQEFPIWKKTAEKPN